MNKKPKKSKNIKSKLSIPNPFLDKKAAYSLPGIILVICIVLFVGLQQENDKLIIRDLGENAFGGFLFSQQVQGSDIMEMGGGVFMEQDTELVSPEMINYNFVYVGDGLELSNDQITVYRTLKGASIGESLSKIVNSIDLNILDFNQFKNLKINNIEVSENRGFGYNIYLDSSQNSLSISSNWEKWPRVFGDNSEMLSDEELVSIADEFLSEYKINTNIYEKGEVVSFGWYGVMHGDVSVIYPLKINDQIVYEQGGQKYGMNLSISLKHKKVTSVYGVIANTFESSQYDKETNTDKIIDFAEDGGLFKSYTYSSPDKVLDLELGTPEVGLVKMWEPSGIGEGMLVPSLIFPIITETSEQPYFYRTNIIVPLVGEFLDQSNMPVFEFQAFE